MPSTFHMLKLHHFNISNVLIHVWDMHVHIYHLCNMTFWMSKRVVITMSQSYYNIYYKVWFTKFVPLYQGCQIIECHIKEARLYCGIKINVILIYQIDVFSFDKLNGVSCRIATCHIANATWRILMTHIKFMVMVAHDDKHH